MEAALKAELAIHCFVGFGSSGCSNILPSSFVPSPLAVPLTALRRAPSVGIVDNVMMRGNVTV